MNARQLLNRLEELRDFYCSEAPFQKRAEELALGLAIITEDIKARRISGSSVLEPAFKQAAKIYRQLYEEYRTLLIHGEVEEPGRIWAGIA